MEIRKYEYDPNFAIRGLHYDVQRVGLIATFFCSLMVFGNNVLLVLFFAGHRN